MDGIAFEGGKGENYPLTIGSGAFIPGFEEQLIGASIGEEVEVNVTFPENYQAEELKGKAAVFKYKPGFNPFLCLGLYLFQQCIIAAPGKLEVLFHIDALHGRSKRKHRSFRGRI